MKLQYNDDLTRNQRFAVVLCYASVHNGHICYIYFEPVYVNVL